MTELAAIQARAQAPIVRVTLNGTWLQQIVSVDVTMGVEQQSSEATIRMPAEQYPSWDTGTRVEIAMGFGGPGGFLRTVFVGETQDIDTKFLPWFIDIKCAGYLKRLQRNAGNTDPLSEHDDPIITWENKTDSEIWTDVMKLGPVPHYTSGPGDARTIVGPIKLMPGTNLRSIIDQLDQASESGQRTFEYVDNVYRIAALRIPGGTPTWKYVEGVPDTDAGEIQLYSLGRQQSDRDLKNQVIIKGVQPAGTATADVVGAVRQVPSNYWGVDGNKVPIYVPFTLQSDFLETRDQCDAVANRYMYEHNKITDVVQMRTPLNPMAMPSRTVGIRSDRMGLASMTNYWIRQIAHHWGSDGASTDWTLEGGAGALGYLVGLPPVPLVEFKITREAYQQGVYDTLSTVYTVTADGSKSYDPDGTALTFAWTSSNGSTGSGAVFTLQFTQAQWDDTTTPPWVQLDLTDSDSPSVHSASTGQLPPVETNTDEANPAGNTKVIAMYVAAYTTAYATPDGWETVNSWSPGGTNVISVARIGALGTNYFGCSNGAIYKTTDYLASAPALAWTAPSAVNALWMSELDNEIIAIGCANGDFFITIDGFLTAPVLKYNFVNAVQWINGSIESWHQWRVCVGQDVWFTNRDFQEPIVYALVAFPGGVVQQNELTPFNNYASANHGADGIVVKPESGPGYMPFPSLSPAPQEAHITAFIATDELLIGDDQGRSFISSPASALTTPVRKTDIGYGAVHDMLRDNTNPLAAYAACDLALAKTFDRAETWHRVLTFDGSVLRGLRIGYESTPLTIPLLNLTISMSTDDKMSVGLAPAHWHESAFDDSGYPNAVLQTSGQGYAYQDYMPEPPSARAGNALINNSRRVFALPDGKIRKAHFTALAYNQMSFFYINGHAIFVPFPPGIEGLDSVIGRDYSFDIPVDWLLPGENNVLTTCFNNGSAAYFWYVPGYPPGNDFCMGNNWTLVIGDG